jgi:CelD/BcsL family acetyltransferase involved in cellulose biosynthesis
MLGPRPKTFATVEILRDPPAAEAVWRDLPPERFGSFFQSPAFLLNWLAIHGARVEPFFIVARDEAGEAVALLPLGLRRQGPLRVAQFLGGKESNYNLGLFRDPDAFDSETVASLLRAAARQPGGPHVYRLQNMPKCWNGRRNPLTRLPHQPSPSPAYCTALAEDGEALLARKLSADTRKKLRKKEKRLTEMGALTYFQAPPRQADAILETYFAQKRRNYALGDESAIVRARRFYLALAGHGLELHVLALDGRPIALLAAALNGTRLHGLINSFDADPDIAKSSPGDLLLTRVLRDACARGLTCFDLGIGEARYKAMFCGEREDMADAVFAPTAIGAAAAPIFSAMLKAKASIKANARLWGALRSLRRRAARGGARWGGIRRGIWP